LYSDERYIHRPLGEEVRAIGGGYFLEKEIRLPFGDREVLVVIGNAVFDNTCCGSGGCRYAFVPGYVRAWHGEEAQEGFPVSAVEPIRDAERQRDIAGRVRELEVVQEVHFI
jgi:hypothetical protein